MNKLIEKLKGFCDIRNWNKYHSPKNLSMAITKECAELMEIFQWKTTNESEYVKLSKKELWEIEEEVGDIFIYLLLLAMRLDIDILMAARKKIELNELKYPASKSCGKNKKYTEL